LHYNLRNEGTANALKMAIAGRQYTTDLIYHSDRGVQYCCYDYTQMLKQSSIQISTTQNGEAYENPIAERVNGILKTEFKLNEIFKSRTQALIEAYYNLGPHMSCGFLTPEQAHCTDQPLVKQWKNRRKKRHRGVPITDEQRI
jgi:transposase InsO family protein